jgi:hypothetical protein
VLWGGKTGCSDEIHRGRPLHGAFSKEPAGGLFLRPISPKQILAYRESIRGSCEITEVVMANLLLKQMEQF